MKRSISTIVAVMGSLLMLLSAGNLQVAAAPANFATAAPAKFTASGFVYVAGVPASTPTGAGFHQKVTGEPVNGTILNSNWNLLTGASFLTIHSSEATFTLGGAIHGSLKGTFTLINGDSLIQGTMSGVISGTWMPSPIGPLITSLSDKGSWHFDAATGTGDFSGVDGNGTWGADLVPTDFSGDGIPDTLAGPLIFQGKSR